YGHMPHIGADSGYVRRPPNAPYAGLYRGSRWRCIRGSGHSRARKRSHPSITVASAPLVVMAPRPDRAADHTEERQNQSDDGQNDPDCPQDRYLQNRSEDQQDDSQGDHGPSPSSVIANGAV